VAQAAKRGGPHGSDQDDLVTGGAGVDVRGVDGREEDEPAEEEGRVVAAHAEVDEGVVDAAGGAGRPDIACVLPVHS